MAQVASPQLSFSPFQLTSSESLKCSTPEYFALDCASNPIALFDELESQCCRVKFVNTALLNLLQKEWEWIGRDLSAFAGSLLANWQCTSFLEFFKRSRENPKGETMVLHVQAREERITRPFKARVRFLQSTYVLLLDPSNSPELGDNSDPSNALNQTDENNFFRPISRALFNSTESSTPSPVTASPGKDKTGQAITPKSSPRRRSKSDRNEFTRSKSSDGLDKLRPQSEKQWRRRAQTLEAALEERSRFMAIMSHEIRTPLFGIMGTLNLLSESALMNQDLEMIRIALVCSEQLSAIINDILDFSKMQENKMVIEKAPFSVQQVIQDSLEVVAMEAANKKIELVYDLFDRIPPRISSSWPSASPKEHVIPDSVLGDSTRVRQIMVNLLSNAVKFSSGGEIIVRIRTNPMEFLPAGSHVGKVMVHFCVEDNGVGIPETARSRMFLPFSQAETSTTRKYGGSGLGLSISKQLAQLMGGDMWFDSQEGQGTMFHFTIAAELLQSFNGTFAPLVPSPTPIDPPKRILLSIENPLLSKVLNEQLTKWGFQVELSSSRDQLIQVMVRQMKARNMIPTRGHKSQDDCRDKPLTRLRSSSESSASGLFPFQLLIVDSSHLVAGMESNKSPGPAWTSWDFAMKSSLIGLIQASSPKKEESRSPEAIHDDALIKAELLDMNVICLDGVGIKDLPSRVKVLKKPIQVHVIKGALLEIFGLSKASEEISAQIAQNRLREKRGQELNLSLLVAEDNPLNQKVIKRILASLGIFDVDIVGDGLQAVQAIKNKKYDVVLMDVQMPVMGGIEASFTIQTEVPPEMRPVIVGLTADVQEENRLTCTSSGMSYFMAKPVNRDLLWENLLEIAQSNGKSPEAHS
eukprot:TRINITY_DN4938_c0_g1_i1.p1 TRINITY_DN4938_c0_g1~~TRINITY_DN4938_c0_g1_i1.p1  ORF type:complete len:866 (+),score=169.76 TRINITY_DN4938_c0_g1_i1:388-2985(+)